MDISVSLRSKRMEKAIKLENPVMVASGILSYGPLLLEACEYLAGAVTKSTGPEPREGNEPPIFYADPYDAFCINAVGLPNQGHLNLADELEEDYPKFQERGKKLFVSVFANNRRDLGKVIRRLKNRYDGVEVNVSCTNIKKGEKTGVYIGKRPGLVRDYTETARNNTDKLLIVKLSPDVYIFDREILFPKCVEAALTGGADAISLNTISGGVKINSKTGEYELTAKYGGVSGRGINPFAVGCVRTIYKNFEDDIQIIGCGGIETPEDIVEMVRAGASAVEIGSVLKQKNKGEIASYTKELVSGLREYLETNELGDLADLRGVTHEGI